MSMKKPWEMSLKLIWNCRLSKCEPASISRISKKKKKIDPSEDSSQQTERWYGHLSSHFFRRKIVHSWGRMQSTKWSHSCQINRRHSWLRWEGFQTWKALFCHGLGHHIQDMEVSPYFWGETLQEQAIHVPARRSTISHVKQNSEMVSGQFSTFLE